MYRPLLALVVATGCGPSTPAATVDPDANVIDTAHCKTRVGYGSTWIAPDGHPDRFDLVTGAVTWDGTCTDDGANSFAELSNGFKPYFAGHSACVISLDASVACNVSATCTTRVSYGQSWIPAANHPDSFDDLDGRVFSDGDCIGGVATLSNGFTPHFTGATCPLAFSYTQCGGLYTNPVIANDCPDPGVLRDGDGYVLSCTSGNAAAGFPIYTSPDLVTWTRKGHVFPSGMRPSWATGDLWAPEIHRVGSHYVAYFSARNSDGQLSIGAASADSATGPFTDLGHPLVHDASMGLIDASEFTASDGTAYLLWKEDGNAVGKPTPIHIQRLAADGLSVTGAVSTLITNDRPWEGAVTEGPFMVEHAGMFYLFYSGNSYANDSYAIGVARGASPTAKLTKLPDPIVTTDDAWVGPGHNSVVDTAAGDTAIVYHAWRAGCVNDDGCGRLTLVDLLHWGDDGWPHVPLAPSFASRPIP